MKGERGAGRAEGPLLHHDIAPSAALLGGLEHEADGAFEAARVRGLLEQASAAEEHGDVRVVAAGVHAAVRA